MRLGREQVDGMASLIVKHLRDQRLVTFRVDETKVWERIRDIFLKDLMVEDELNREVERILESHSRDMQQSDVDYRKMFQLVKAKLARERNIVL
ncbi:MAG: DUF507 family protein [Deltaproteobacteria bacterium]|nr:DUF507 family protein [Deltaproteobacteria bacterium]